MTDNEIIKALERLHKRILKSSFAKYVTETEIMGLINALDLIKRKTAEIESLTAMLERSQEKYEIAIDAPIRAKTKDIKEFAEKLKQSAFDCDVSFGYGNGCYVKAVTTIEIDNLVKEMVGE